MALPANRPHAKALDAPAAVRDNPKAAKLAFEIALGYYSPEELHAQFELSPEQYRAVTTNPLFIRAVQAYRREIDETGQDFKIKARKLAFAVLDDLSSIAVDPLAEPKDRIDAIREISRLAGYGNKEENGAGSVPTFALQINLGPNTPAPTIIPHGP